MKRKSHLGYSSLVIHFVVACFFAVSEAVDLPEGNYTAQQLELLEKMPFNSSWCSKTPLNGDGSHESNILTIILDFKAPGSPITQDIFGGQVGVFDVTGFGFGPNQFDQVVNAIAAKVDEDFFSELVGTPAGPPDQDLRIDFRLGDIGVAPAGVSEFYFIQIGSAVDPAEVALGRAGVAVVRNTAGNGPNDGIRVGDVVGSVFTDNINMLGGLNPVNALTSGNFEFTSFAISGTVSHEIGHSLSLRHLNKAGSVTPRGFPPIMGTGSIDLLNQDRIGEHEFAFSGTNAELAGVMQFQIQQLTDAVGLHSTVGQNAPGPTSTLECFSRHNTVHIREKGLVSINNVQIGDWVQVRGKNKYAKVYSLAHWNDQEKAQFLRITAQTKTSETTIEVTPDHVLYFVKQSFFVDTGWSRTAPASGIRIGDSLLSVEGIPAIVTAIGTVTRQGVFAPFTTSGDIVVSDLVVSNYAEIMDTAHLGIPVSFHWIAHTFQAFHRLSCRMNFQWCHQESYTASGVSTWIPSWYDIVRNQDMLVQRLILLMALPIALFLCVAENVLTSRWVWAILAGAAVARLMSRKWKRVVEKCGSRVLNTVGQPGKI